METMEQKIEKFKAEQTEKLSKYEAELRLCEGLGLNENDAFFHNGGLYGVGASVHFRKNMSFSDAIETLEKMEAHGEPATMVEYRKGFFSLYTKDYFQALPDEEVTGSKAYEILPIKLELNGSRWQTLHYWLKLNQTGKVVHFKIDTDFFPYQRVETIHSGKTKQSRVVEAYLRGTAESFAIHDQEGETLGSKRVTKMASGGMEPSEHFIVTFEKLWDDAHQNNPFKISLLKNWLTK